MLRSVNVPTPGFGVTMPKASEPKPDGLTTAEWRALQTYRRRAARVGIELEKPAFGTRGIHPYAIDKLDRRFK